MKSTGIGSDSFVDLIRKKWRRKKHNATFIEIASEDNITSELKSTESAIEE